MELLLSSCDVKVAESSEKHESCNIAALTHCTDENMMPAASVCSIYTLENLFLRPYEDEDGDANVSNQGTNEKHEHDETKTRSPTDVNYQHRLMGLQAQYKTAQKEAKRTIASLQSQVSSKVFLMSSLKERNTRIRKQSARNMNELKQATTQLAKARAEMEIMTSRLTQVEHQLTLESRQKDQAQAELQQMQLELLQYKAKNQVLRSHEDDISTKLKVTQKELAESRIHVNRINGRFNLGEVKLCQVNQELQQCRALQCATTDEWKKRLQEALQAATRTAKKALNERRQKALFAKRRHKEEYARVCTRVSKMESTIERKDEVIQMLECRSESDKEERLQLLESVERLENAEKSWIRQIEMIELELWREKKASFDEKARDHHSTQTDMDIFSGSVRLGKPERGSQSDSFHVRHFAIQMKELEQSVVRLRALHAVEMQAQKKAYDELIEAYKKRWK
uniref:AlNc14C106G6239 protein n=1 Tax=Albugo laibachii Nc14 TaxID=890382 RepID=F0WI32_9STRA|nr:AlNc14C106G6239 [Albugo laibachii Nc14]|eukprot:CCA20910.1 AlNc14C106G6239 [Albugo laibachii Nc14]